MTLARSILCFSAANRIASRSAFHAALGAPSPLFIQGFPIKLGDDFVPRQNVAVDDVLDVFVDSWAVDALFYLQAFTQSHHAKPETGKTVFSLSSSTQTSVSNCRGDLILSRNGRDDTKR